MIIKTYIVKDMKEALIRAKYEFGADAVIISQREVKIGKWYNPFKEKGLEVTIAAEHEGQGRNNAQTKAKAKYSDIDSTSNESIDNDKDPLINGPFPQRLETKISLENDSNGKLRRQIDIYSQLLGKDKDSLTLDEKKGFVQLVMKDNPLNNKLNLGKVNVLVGPTGVGKTTTIAKLAATEYISNKKKVGLITIDTYRIGAVEQLRTYADILSIDFEVANNPDEMTEKVKKLSNCDIILIDTLGTSPKDIAKIEDIKGNLNAIDEEINTYLVLSLSTDRDTIVSILEKYKSLDYNAFIITKIDEVSNTSNLWYLIENCTDPIQYFCHGQDVPDDIKIATIDNVFDYCKENDLYE